MPLKALFLVWLKYVCHQTILLLIQLSSLWWEKDHLNHCADKQHYLHDRSFIQCLSKWAFFECSKCLFFMVGQEEGDVGIEEGITITPFNMKEELEEGHFDKDGTYIFAKEVGS